MGLMKASKTDFVVSTTTEELSNDSYTRGSKSLSQFNKLLNWSRLDRGPQWDFGTATYMVPKNSEEYYKGVERVEGSDPNPTQPPTTFPSSAPPKQNVNLSTPGGPGTPLSTGIRTRGSRTRGGG